MLKKRLPIIYLFILLVICIFPFCIALIVDFALTGNSDIVSEYLTMPLTLVGAIISYIILKKENIIIYKFSVPRFDMIFSAFLFGFTFKQTIICLLHFLVKLNVSGNDKYTVYNLIVSVLVAAVCEEMVFRGAITDILKCNGPKSNILIVIFTSALWAFSHLYGLSLPTLLLFVDGIILGYIYCKTQNIILCMIYHAANNASIIILGSIKAELWNFVFTIDIILLVISVVLFYKLSNNSSEL